MLKSLIIGSMTLLTLTQAQAAVVRIQERECTNYTINDSGKLSEDEVMVLNKRVYGLYIDDMNVDFDNRQVKFDLRAAVILGLNRNVLRNQIKINDSHPRFKKFVNLLNKDLHLLHEVCLNRDYEVVRFKLAGEDQQGETSN